MKYPQETLHEIITNAVLHRDYSVTDDIHVRIFENRIEVESPGRLPGHITPENILAERLSRNPNIVRHLNRFPDPPNQDIGEGLDTAFEFMRKLNLRNPEILDKEHSVLVIIRHESFLASPARQIVDFLSTNDSVRNEQARRMTGINSESKMKKIFEQLIAAGEIEHIPGTARARLLVPPPPVGTFLTHREAPLGNCCAAGSNSWATEGEASVDNRVVVSPEFCIQALVQWRTVTPRLSSPSPCRRGLRRTSPHDRVHA